MNTHSLLHFHMINNFNAVFDIRRKDFGSVDDQLLFFYIHYCNYSINPNHLPQEIKAQINLYILNFMYLCTLMIVPKYVVS